MTDLHELLHEMWCPKCCEPAIISPDVKPWIWDCGGKHERLELKCPLATRMPEAVPAGLEWNSRFNYWCIRHQTVTGPSDRPLVFGETMCSPDHAELLFIGNAVKVLSAADWFVQFRGATDKIVVEGDDLVEVEIDGTIPAALTAALHRLADERDEAKETASE